jgi:hypothetical protein
MSALLGADLAIVVGFAMSDYDAMAQMQFGEVARERHTNNTPLKVVVIDPNTNEGGRMRYRGVFRNVEFIAHKHEEVNWAEILSRIV